jgi:hypothetical protein
MYNLNGAPAEPRGPINWSFVMMLFSLLAILTVVFSSGFSLGHTMGYYDGHIAGYIARGLEVEPHAPCHGKPNCEVVE